VILSDATMLNRMTLCIAPALFAVYIRRVLANIAEGERIALATPRAPQSRGAASSPASR
jgi:hypothetical protein